MILTNKSEVKSCKDTALLKLISSKENCRRKLLLEGLSSDESLTTQIAHCCDACGDLPTPNLKFIRPIRARRNRKPKAVRQVPEQTMILVKNRLQVERKHLIHGSGKIKAFGGAMICPFACIEEICNRVNYIKGLQDISNISGLRDKFARVFFNVVKNILML